MVFDLDMIVEPGAAPTPLGIDIRLLRQWLERRPVEIFEQLAARDAKAAQGTLLVDIDKHVLDSLVQAPPGCKAR